MSGDIATPLFRLYELDGTPLATGRCPTAADTTIDAGVVVIVDQPGRVVQRCLLGPVHELLVVCGDDGGRWQRAVVERVFFEPGFGRLCVLRIESAPFRPDVPRTSEYAQ